MKYLLSIYILFMSPVFAEEQMIDVLVITGGKQFDRQEFFAIFDSFTGVRWETESYPKAADVLFGDDLDADVVVFYDMYQDISEQQQVAFIKLLHKGRPCLFLHHALVSYQSWDEYEKIVGGRYYDVKRWQRQPPERGYSTFRHNVDIPVKIVDVKHPVTDSMRDFVIRDEVYGKFDMEPGVTPLLITGHPENEPVTAWTHTYGNSKVVYIQFGHNKSAFADPNYRQLILNAIRYLDASR